MKSFRSTIESAFYGNNVCEVSTRQSAYCLAKVAPSTIVTGMLVSHCEDLGLKPNTKVLVDNHGEVVGRSAKARRIIGVDQKYDYNAIMREAIYDATKRGFIKARAIVGLDAAFSMKAHLMIPKDDANNLYNFLLNFQEVNKEEEEGSLKKEKDVFLFVDPEWSDERFPDGLVLLDPEDNVGAVLGLRYFGEIKKSVLSLVWNAARRHDYIACHGGIKEVTTPGGPFVMAVFGLSGSGKSTITLSDHEGRLNTKILHDDAFIVSKKDGHSIALEPSYFDKTADYPAGHPQQAYFITAQNVGVTSVDSKVVLVTEDIRNGNGRTIKSQYCTKNRVNRFDKSLDAVFWIMKDDAFPPLLKVESPMVSAVMGAMMTTKRSNAEHGGGGNKQVIEPYANPFRLYDVKEDFEDFKELFEQGVACYILNTGFFNGKKITPTVTLSAIESVIDGTCEYLPFAGIDDLSYLKIPGYDVDMDDELYQKLVLQSFQFRSEEASILPDAAQAIVKNMQKSLQK